MLSSSSPNCDFLELQRRYRSLLVPSDLLAVCLSWLSAFPLSQPFSLHPPSRIQVSSEKEPAPDAGAEPIPADSDPTYSSKVSRLASCLVPWREEKALKCVPHTAHAQVLLLSSPGLEEFYRCCMLFVDDLAEPRETPEHPLKQIKVRASIPEAGGRRGWWMVRPCQICSSLAPIHELTETGSPEPEYCYFIRRTAWLRMFLSEKVTWLLHG